MLIINIINMEYDNNINEIELKETFIDDDKKISFEYLYSKIKLYQKELNSKNIYKFNYDNNNNNNNSINKNNNNNNITIEIIRKCPLFYDINLYVNKIISKTFKQVFFEPITIFYGKTKIEMAFLEQFNNISKLLNIKNPALECYKSKEQIDFKIKQLIMHLKKCKCKNECEIHIYNKKNNQYNDFERKFYNIFNNIIDSNEYETPMAFDLNYEDYFDFYKYQVNDKKFEFFDDKDSARSLSVANLCCSNGLLGLFRIYFGQTGMGKSITLIKAFKYNYDHDSFGTLYIHCKCLYKYYFNNSLKMKKILKDEIIFLFKNEYQKYKKCSIFIDNYKNNINIFDLVIQIIKKFCDNKSKKYIFIFDQYKSEYDTTGALNDLNQTLIKKNSNYGMIACCSMDNKSVRELKVKNLSKRLFEDEIINETMDNVIVEEINELFNTSKLIIDYGGIYDITLDKIGKNLKNYIALREFHRKKDYVGMENYVKDIRQKIDMYLKEFFNLNKKIKEDNDTSNLTNLHNILSFTVNTEYQLNYIKDIKNNIPFKYFDIKKIENNENAAKIVFNYKIVGEVMNKIYEFIIYENNNIYKIFANIDLDKGALGGLYEKYVIHFMEPDRYIKIRKLFNYFNIKEIVNVEKFVPTSKEKYFKRQFITKSLKEGDYLFKQEQFGGKAFDCAIIRITKNAETQVFLFQISIYNHKIYKLDDLNKLIETFIKYFSFQFEFTIKKENVYFTYIFHTEDKSKLLKECKKNKLKCIFFNPSYQIFTDENDIDLSQINSINNIFANPFYLINKDLDIQMKDMISINKLNSITKPNYIINIKQKKNIEKIWKNIFNKDTIVEIFYSHNTHFIDEKYLSNEIMYLRVIDEDESEEWIQAITEEDKDKEISEKNNLLLIYRQTNLQFRIISENGIMLKLKYIPIGIKCDLKNYDIYIAKFSLENQIKI